ncbi:hypothetical protein KCP69_08400 [Salmonella enterica subsp. enterica]|nr:hypothetical protein KCP69_08400 [Salmonella enterica subsp. enterica]
MLSSQKRAPVLLAAWRHGAPAIKNITSVAFSTGLHHCEGSE